MPSKPVTIGPFKGINNRLADRMLPSGILRNAVNVVFDDAGLAHFPGWGKTKVYNGTNIHSLCNHLPLFVENGTLKILNADYTATALRSGMGSSEVFYTTVGNITFFCNEAVTGKYDANTRTVSEWGVDRPSRQPDCAASQVGGLYAGDYRVAITWFGSDSVESGTGMGRRVTVPEGGGINVSNFPVPPAYVTKVGVYVSSVNGKDLYWYGDYIREINYVNIGRLTAQGVEPAIALTTQFCYPPKPRKMISAFNGRIYYAQGNKVFYTNPHNYGLQKPLQYWMFEGEVLAIHSVPPMLFVQTDEALNSITAIDNGEAPPQFNRIKNYSGTPGVTVHGSDDASAYSYTDNGFIQCNNDGTVAELSFKDNALPSFSKGAITIVERNGTKYLVFSGTDGTQNPLADAAYNAAELIRGSL